jgi:hypothetical protein
MQGQENLIIFGYIIMAAANKGSYAMRVSEQFKSSVLASEVRNGDMQNLSLHESKNLRITRLLEDC